MFASERLSVDHALAGFDSGQPDLDHWLRVVALDQQERRYSSTFVWTDGGPKVIAYFTLLSHSVDREDVPKKVGRGGPARIPAILVAKLALATKHQGRGFGTYLLLDALSRCLGATEVGPGARLVVVDAIDTKAYDFYRAHDFIPVAPDAMTLSRTMKDVAQDIHG